MSSIIGGFVNRKMLGAIGGIGGFLSGSGGFTGLMESFNSIASGTVHGIDMTEMMSIVSEIMPSVAIAIGTSLVSKTLGGRKGGAFGMGFSTIGKALGLLGAFSGAYAAGYVPGRLLHAITHSGGNPGIPGGAQFGSTGRMDLPIYNGMMGGTYTMRNVPPTGKPTFAQGAQRTSPSP